MMNRGRMLKVFLGQALLASWLVVLPGCPVEYCLDAKWDVGVKVTSHPGGEVVADALVYYQASLPGSPQPVLTADADPALFAACSASTDSGGSAMLGIVEGYYGPPPWMLESLPTEPAYEYRVRIDAGDGREVLTVPIVVGATGTGGQFTVEVVSVESPEIIWLWDRAKN